MEKEIYTRHLSREGTGCVWLFMNMFDLRHGGSNHKLLLDRKRGSKRITVCYNAGTETKVEKQLTCDCDCEVLKSVKKLIEEEIDEKTHQKCDTTECRGRTKARHKKMRSRTCSKTNEDINALITGDDDHAEKKPDDQCPRTSQSDADSINNDDSEEKFSELIKRLIAQKESEVESCKSSSLHLHYLFSSSCKHWIGFSKGKSVYASFFLSDQHCMNESYKDQF
ncbi:BnaC04g04600D [Brassica napus]|uniref:BnaC04g04600D protein n=1 Tax=Brassica napus TaxID=3708 RepID=A0A078FWT3_BRANA|nr:BnaC04g04600D [Brassica napus]